MDSRFAKAVVAVAKRMADESDHLEVDDEAIKNPDIIVETGLVIRVYPGRQNGLDWEGTFVLDPREQTCSEPHILAAVPNDVYDDRHTPKVIPQVVRDSIDAAIQPLKEALSFTQGDRVIVNMVQMALERDRLSLLMVELVHQMVEDANLPEQNLSPENEIAANPEPQRAPAAFGSFG